MLSRALLNTLDRKLAAVLLVVILALGAVAAYLTVTTTRTYTEAALQRLNRNLARQIVDEQLLITGQGVEEEALKHAFHQLMVINPAIEVYLLDAEGSILSYSAPPGRVKRTRVSLDPIRAFLDEREPLPVLGDDPREEGRRKIFSAAPIRSEGRLRGYLYIILAGEQYTSELDRLVGSRILRLSVGMAVLSALVLLALALGLVRLLTRRLRRLTAEMEKLGRGAIPIPSADSPASDTPQPAGRQGDEVERLEQGFRRMAQRIADQIRELQQLDAHRRELVANVSHDLRTPLAQIQGYLETLVLKEERLSPEERREYLEVALRQTERLARLVAELFELARLDARTRGPDVEVFSPAELVQDVVQKFRLEAEDRGVVLEADLPSDAPFVRADLGLVERLLDNLIENAFRHTPAGGSVTVSLRSVERAVRIEVADTGEGIEPERMKDIFERFRRGPAGRGREDEGAGLGLPIARRIAELHGSTLDCQSSPGEGARFSFLLPAAAPAAGEPSVRGSCERNVNNS